MKVRSVAQGTRAAFLVAVLLVFAVALPASALAAAPEEGAFDGPEGVGFVVGRSQHGTLMVRSAEFRTHIGGSARTISGFREVFAHDGSFETCARHGHVVFREYCIAGHFASPDGASGSVKVFQGAHGHVASQPFETHHWSAKLQ